MLRDGYVVESLGRTAVDLPIACKSLLWTGASRGGWQCLAMIYADCAAVDRAGVRRWATCQIEQHPNVACHVPTKQSVTFICVPHHCVHACAGLGIWMPLEGKLLLVDVLVRWLGLSASIFE